MLENQCLITNILYAKKKVSIRQVRAAKSKHKAIRSGTRLRENKTKRKVNSRINYHIKKYLYNWIMRHPQVVQSPILMIVRK